MANAEPSVRLGRMIQYIRKDAGLTRLSLCQDALVSKETLAKIEAGKQEWQTEEVERVCDALGVDPPGDLPLPRDRKGATRIITDA